VFDRKSRDEAWHVRGEEGTNVAETLVLIPMLNVLDHKARQN